MFFCFFFLFSLGSTFKSNFLSHYMLIPDLINYNSRIVLCPLFVFFFFLFFLQLVLAKYSCSNLLFFFFLITVCVVIVSAQGTDFATAATNCYFGGFILYALFICCFL